MKQPPRTAAPPETGAPAVSSIPRDQYTGRGGSYTFDPATKIRQPANTKQQGTAERKDNE